MAYIIAEIGVNHNRSMPSAKNLIISARHCGADAVKFQLYDAEELEPPGERRDMLQSLQLSREQIHELKIEAENQGLDFICTPFDIGSLKFLLQIGVDYLKISSGDCRNFGLLTAAVGHDYILSTGMSYWSDVRDALYYKPTVLMHCVSAYPCPPQDVNLRVIPEMLNFGKPVGLSDHTTSTIIPAAAVALGATFIEKHLTLHKGLPGPDHLSSLEPREFQEMVENIREVEASLGDGAKRPMSSEVAVMRVREEREKWRRR